MTLLLHFFYYAKLVNPWYDQTALFFYFIAQIIVLYNIEKKIEWWKLCIVGFLVLLSVFSKQDVGKVNWVWIDTNTRLPITSENKEILDQFKKCLVCPERWGRPEDINLFLNQMHEIGFFTDAVMTSIKYINHWL
jgi:hypothetical protein